jgi:threonine/homoserine/homoserine lactone efflux protein
MRALRYLGSPTYLVAFLFVFVPFLDLLVNLWPVQPRNIRWRVAMMGQLSGGMMTVMLGFLLAILAAHLLEQPRVQRAMIALSGLMGLVLLGILGLFILDVLQLRPEIRPEVRRAFDMVAIQAFIKLFLSLVGAAVFVWSGLRALREERKARRARGAEGPVVMVGTRGPTAETRPG